jgi:hypothetical protein
MSNESSEQICDSDCPFDLGEGHRVKDHPRLPLEAEAQSIAEPELLPCPFCQKQPVPKSEIQGERTWYWIECEHVGCYINPASGQDFTIEEAARHWNTRSPTILSVSADKALINVPLYYLR